MRCFRGWASPLLGLSNGNCSRKRVRGKNLGQDVQALLPNDAALTRFSFLTCGLLLGSATVLYELLEMSLYLIMRASKLSADVVKIEGRFAYVVHWVQGVSNHEDRGVIDLGHYLLLLIDDIVVGVKVSAEVAKEVLEHTCR